MLASELAVVQDIALEEAEKQLDEAIAFHGT
jgi:RNA polymerase-interacting CarD/CdnL/TRCF family regulator